MNIVQYSSEHAIHTITKEIGISNAASRISSNAYMRNTTQRNLPFALPSRTIVDWRLRWEFCSSSVTAIATLVVTVDMGAKAEATASRDATRRNLMVGVGVCVCGADTNAAAVSCATDQECNDLRRLMTDVRKIGKFWTDWNDCSSDVQS